MTIVGYIVYMLIEIREKALSVSLFEDVSSKKYASKRTWRYTSQEDVSDATCILSYSSFSDDVVAHTVCTYVD